MSIGLLPFGSFDAEKLMMESPPFFFFEKQGLLLKAKIPDADGGGENESLSNPGMKKEISHRFCRCRRF